MEETCLYRFNQGANIFTCAIRKGVYTYLLIFFFRVSVHPYISIYAALFCSLFRLLF